MEHTVLSEHIAGSTNSNLPLTLTWGSNYLTKRTSFITLAGKYKRLGELPELKYPLICIYMVIKIGIQRWTINAHIDWARIHKYSSI